MFPKITFAWLLSAVCANNVPAFHAHHAPSAFVISSLASRSRAKSTAVHDEHCHPPFLPFTTMPHTAATNMIRLAPLSIAAGSNIDKSEYDLSSSANEKTEDEAVHISIEYCSACQWMLRGSWLASELLTTFAKESRLNSVTLIPKGPPLSEGGIFRISATMGINANILSHSSADSGLEEKDGATILLWDRKIEGRFPESKEVKQLIRDVVNPDKDLGHSDRKESDPNNSVNEVSTKEKQVDCIECQQQEQDEAAMGIPQQPIQLEKVETNSLEQSSIPPIFYTNNHVSIEYSTGAAIASAENGLYRANWYANELLSMVYARNAWWKTQQQTKEDGNIGAEKDSNENNGHDASVPPAVDCVTLIPNRKELGVLVSVSLVVCHVWSCNCFSSLFH